jgi:hypothetical protein
LYSASNAVWTPAIEQRDEYQDYKEHAGPVQPLHSESNASALMDHRSD